MLPVPLINLINGGRHASNDLDFQEFIIMPVGADSLLHALQIGTEVNLELADILLDRFGKVALNTGDEGGFAPPMSSPHEALEFLHEAVARVGLRGAASCTASTAPRRTSTTRRRDTYTVAGERYDRDALIGLYQRADPATSASSRSRIRCTRRTSRASPS